jgi:hypothetical protein
MIVSVGLSARSSFTYVQRPMSSTPVVCSLPVVGPMRVTRVPPGLAKPTDVAFVDPKARWNYPIP